MKETPFVVTRSVNGLNGFGLQFTDNNENALLVLGVEQHFTIPSNYQDWELVITYQPGSTVWMAVNDTAVAPAGAFGLSTSQLNPAGRQVKAGDVVSFITSDATALINVSLYYLNSNNRS